MLKRTGAILLVIIFAFGFSSFVLAWDTIEAGLDEDGLQRDTHFVGFRQLKEDLPFSYIDPRMHWTYDGEEFRLAKEEEKGYDYWGTLAVESTGSGEDVERDPSLGAGIIAHEEFHDHIILPLHMSEGGAEIALIVAEAETKEDLQRRLNYYEQFAIRINRIYDENLLLYESYKKGEIGREEFLKRRTRAPVELCFNHTYTYYFLLMHRLFVAFNCDMDRFTAELKNLPRYGCETPGEMWDHSFEEQRQWEIELEKQIEDIIAKNTKKSK